MKKSNLLISLFLLILGINACDQTKKLTETSDKNIPMADNSMTSLDWDGVYIGTIPCADCPGIQTVIRLNQDLSYTMKSRYLEKGNEVFTNQGSFSWNADGGKISLETDKKQEDPSMFLVGENRLFMLDRSGNRIDGDLADKYVLDKIMDGIEGKYWKLVEINGRAVPEDGSFRTQPHLQLDSENQTASGNGGCNNFNGGYELKEGQRISFAQMASTRMACPDMTVENQLLEALQRIDNYTINNDQMTLSKGRMAPLVRFEAVYLR